ncbi:protein CNGC15b [Dioscorea cayenensis subsp. rotundata]|uniref:Protein CNGC15b n=1 Tax=Dioscorea cayennensis subsp. rotundata TaxID=55577 RepID=A0AB40CH01_DIOCR|nr:protein CNGC15b [Dioscorea cayenensis subsp. rotundata]
MAAYSNSRSMRFEDDIESKPRTMFTLSKSNKVHPEKQQQSLKHKMLSRVFSEDYSSAKLKKKILDPRGSIIHRWNKIFLLACIVSLFVDPLFFYLTETQSSDCINIDTPLEVVLTIIRSLADVFYAMHIFIKFRTAYVAPSSRVFGRGELIIDPSKIACRYINSKSFWLDLFAALPLPQFMIWFVIPGLKGSMIRNTKNIIQLIIIVQYIPKLFLIFPLSSQIVKSTGVLLETAWAGAVYNLILYMLASHVLGACWYLLGIDRKEGCWREACQLQSSLCQFDYFDCQSISDTRNTWYQSSNLSDMCSPNSSFYDFGIYGEALSSRITSLSFFHKYFYCLWWGLKNLSSLGQNLSTSTHIDEIIFAIIIAILGLVLFGLLIGNMQSYLQSTTVRIEEWRIKKTDTEQWMRHRQLPPDLRQYVRRYEQYRWLATRGVDEEALLNSLPMDLRRDIKRHLCLDLVRRVPLFDQMDERMLEAICERLRPALYTDGTYVVRELDPVNEMIFIIRGHLDSTTTDGGRTGFFNSCRIGPGDFCGEELLTWALDPRPSACLPSSTRTVRAISEVEAFALVSSDLKFVASQFRRLHSKQLRQKFRFYSHHWRTWAACFIQAAWRRHKRRRSLKELSEAEGIIELMEFEVTESETNVPNPGPEAFVARLVASSRRGTTAEDVVVGMVKPLKKPTEPDFSVDEDI